eukprot:CAMPEP_0118829308 /NCGR_PEP_ID=MMETSP1162-20130426/23014_1 /TAXON_ID=33656 /ORGANISM="Phaeocystis Sp, Strain CCMP2710" /LENGTH=159 /DNA_ID=CAMNT_0006760467 /DNA_START=60 /DNA_END=539 /DNA_ORIENTATION=+
MMATDARFTLAQLKHWDTRLSQELEILEHDIEASEATHHKYGGKCSEALLALRALRVEKELRWGEVRGAIDAITTNLERAAAAPITEDLKPPPLLIFAPNHAAAARAHGSWRPLPAARQFAPEMPIAGTRAHAAMLRSRLASPILQHSPAQERRKLVFG